jgi:hypothetical protein
MCDVDATLTEQRRAGVISGCHINEDTSDEAPEERQHCV